MSRSKAYTKMLLENQEMSRETTRFTPERQEKILSMIRSGNTINVALKVNGVSAALFHTVWSRKAREGEEEYVRFFDQIQTAVAESEARMVDRVEGFAAEEAQSAQWMLSRRHRRDWSPKSAQEHDAAVAKAEAETARIAAQTRLIEAQIRLLELRAGQGEMTPEQLAAEIAALSAVIDK